ncbi:fimbrial protein [Pantoea sp. NPDC088449]|uniref:fimbrial protein n=1 Tax=Pantoea sp. NPDC088449 TaxID=3364392 RepID=UPI000EF040A1|nr:fimbria A protein [Pantoea sp.]
MKLNKIMVAMGFGLVMMAGTANAIDDQGHGTVTIKGSIIDAPCSITPETIDQTVNLGQVSNVQLKDGGKSNPQSFSIKLENCDLAADKHTAQITFTGMESAGNPELIGMTGSAEGASIGLTNGAGTLIKLGEPTDVTIQNGNNTLAFSAYLQGDPAPAEGTLDGANIVPGTFQSVVSFNLAYP